MKQVSFCTCLLSLLYVSILAESRYTNGSRNMTSCMCLLGNPGEFVPCVGANRRRMNITSEIARPGAQQCQIVDVNSWNEFFPPRD